MGSNHIQILHGSSIPNNIAYFENYELGFCTQNDFLYIRKADEIVDIKVDLSAVNNSITILNTAINNGAEAEDADNIEGTPGILFRLKQVENTINVEFNAINVNISSIEDNINSQSQQISSISNTLNNKLDTSIYNTFLQTYNDTITNLQSQDSTLRDSITTLTTRVTNLEESSGNSDLSNYVTTSVFENRIDLINNNISNIKNSYLPLTAGTNYPISGDLCLNHKKRIRGTLAPTDTGSSNGGIILGQGSKNRNNPIILDGNVLITGALVYNGVAGDVTDEIKEFYTTGWGVTFS